MLREIDNFYFQKEEPNKSCLMALREIILAYNTDITEAWKYGMPCFCYLGKALVYLWMDRKTQEPYILVVKGNKLEHPLLVKGNRSRMKTLIVDPSLDIPLETIHLILKMTIALYP
jgi:hypothetical protein